MQGTGKASTRSAALPSYVSARYLLLAFFSAVLIAGCGVLIDYFVHGATRLYASDGYTLLIGFVFSYILLGIEERRRANLARRMQIAAEVNHHIRNAITGVVYTAAVRNDPALQAVLEDATARIDWVLNTVLPDGTSELKWPVQSKDWSPSSWQNAGTHQSTPRTGTSGEGKAVSPSN